MEYGIITCQNPETMVDKVQEALRWGWELQGGISTCVLNGVFLHTQALTRTKFTKALVEGTKDEE